RNVEDTIFRTDGSPAPIDRQEETGTAETRAFLMRSFPTLGERMARMARSIISRRIPAFPWLQPLETVIEHLASLPVPAQERFQRVEALPHRAFFQKQRGAEAAVWSMGGSSRTSHPAEMASEKTSISGWSTMEPGEVLAGTWPLVASPQPMPGS